MKKRLRKSVSMLLALVMILSMTLGNIAPLVAIAEGGTPEDVAVWGPYSSSDKSPASYDAAVGIAATSGKASGTSKLFLEGALKYVGSTSNLTVENWAVDKYLEALVDGSGHTALKLSLNASGSKTGPANMKVQYSIGESNPTWTDLKKSDGTQVTFQIGEKVKPVLADLELPAECGKNKFRLRFIVIDDKSVKGETIQAKGTFKIRSLSVTGVADSTASGGTGGGTTTPATVPHGELATTLESGNSVVIYNKDLLMAPKDDETKKNFPSVKTAIEGDKAIIYDDALIFEVEKDASGYVRFKSGDKYLAIDEAVKNMVLISETGASAALLANSWWELEPVNGQVGTFRVKNKAAVYAKNPQYLEVYNGEFTFYSYNAGKDDLYKFKFYGADPAKVTKRPVAPPPQQPVGEIAKLITTFTDGDQIVIYNDGNDAILTGEASGNKLKGVKALEKKATEKTIMVPDNGLRLKMYKVQGTSNEYFFVDDMGRFLTAVSSGVKMNPEKTDDAVWIITVSKASTESFIMQSKTIKFNDKPQYFEYYNNFTTYSMSSEGKAFYTQFYRLKAGDGKPYKEIVVDSSQESAIARWAGRAVYEKNGNSVLEIFGDDIADNDMLDKNAKFTSFVGGKNVPPYIVPSSPTGNWYMGGKSLGTSGANKDYVQMELSTKGYGNIKAEFRLRTTAAGSGAYTVKYSTDNVNYRNLSSGTYAYNKKISATESKAYSGTISDGVAKVSMNAGDYINFKFDLPQGAADAGKLYIRLVADGKRADEKSTAVGEGSTFRCEEVKIKGSPIVDDNITAFVTVTPDGGAVALGQTLTMESKTVGAKILYTINGGTEQEYNANSKPVLNVLPATLKVRAEKAGMASSITRTILFEQGKCEGVTAAPRAGGVRVGRNIKLSTETEGATIKYVLTNDALPTNPQWKDYTEEGLTLTALPIKIYAKAVKDGFKDSPVAAFEYTEKSGEKYNIYFGQIHSHTNISDGSGTLKDAYTYANGKVDFLAVTDHSNYFDDAANGEINTNTGGNWEAAHNEADKHQKDGSFTAIYGYEMTWSGGPGHMNTYNTVGFQSRTQTEFSTKSSCLENYYKKLETAPQSISMFNHPGPTFGDFDNFGHFSKARDELITMLEVGNGEGDVGGTLYFPSYDYYIKALDKGWHVAPTNNQDNHLGEWGDGNTCRTVALAYNNTRSEIYDAMKNYRIYATEDENLRLYYTLNDEVMGTIFDKSEVGDKVNIKVEVEDKNAEACTVEVVVSGGESIASKKLSASADTQTVEFTLDNKYPYYFIRITQEDKNIAVTAPVWTDNVEACGISDVYTNTNLAKNGESADINVTLFNNEPQDFVIEKLELVLNGEVVKTVTGKDAGVELLKTGTDATYTFNYTYPNSGVVEYEVRAYGVIKGNSRSYSGSVKLNYMPKEILSKVVINGEQFNEYVSGNYAGNMNSLAKLAATLNIDVTIEKKLTDEILKDCDLLILTPPARSTSDGKYTAKNYTDEFIATVKRYVDGGGNVIVSGLADYGDRVGYVVSEQQNKLLKAIGSTLEIRNDEAAELKDDGSANYRLYFTNYDMADKYLAGVANGQKYSQYSGCTVNIDNPINGDVTKPVELVRGGPKTFSFDSRDASGNKTTNMPKVVEEGKVTALAYQELTKTGSKVFVSGAVFMSDFEVKFDADNANDVGYSNGIIMKNILKSVRKDIKPTPIKTARKAKMGEVFMVEGYVTAGTELRQNKFFDAIYIQDETGGICVFPYGDEGLKLGTKVRVVGYLDQYQGEIELQIMTIELLEDAPVIYEPKVLNTDAAMDYDTYGGSLLKTQGTVTRIKMNTAGTEISEFWLMDGTRKEAAIFIDGYIGSATDPNKKLDISVGDVVSAVGLLYKHPEDNIQVPVFRVRNTDEIEVISEAKTYDITAQEDGAAKFDLNAPEDKLRTVKIDGVLLTEGKDYTIEKAENGDAILIFSDTLLKSLAVGKHDVEVLYADGLGNSSIERYAIKDKKIVNGVLSFTCMGEFADFIDLYMDGKKLVEDTDYTCDEGSTIITFTKAFMAKNNVNKEHIVKLSYKNGSYGLDSVNFSLAAGNAGATGGNVPKESDGTNIPIWMLTAMISFLMAMAFAANYKSKRNGGLLR